MAAPRAIDMDLFNAQQARRVLDRLVGYKLSPFLWKKVRRGLSAGRVQSVAVRLIVDREKEIEAFKPEEYWNIDARSSPPSSSKKIHRAPHGAGGRQEAGRDERRAERRDRQGPGRRGLYRVLHQQGQAEKGARAPVYHLHHAAGGQPPAGLYGNAHHARGAGRCTRAWTLQGRAPMGLITYMRTDSPAHCGRGAGTRPRTYHRRDAMARSMCRPQKRTLQKQKRHGRAGRPRGGAAHKPRSDARPRWKRALTARPVLSSTRLIWSRFIASQMSDCHAGHRHLPTSRAAGYLFRATRLCGRRSTALPRCTRKARDDARGRKRPRCRRCEEGMPLKLPGAEAQAALHPAARALYRGDAHQGAGGKRHRPSVHLCARSSPPSSTANYVEREQKALAPTTLGRGDQRADDGAVPQHRGRQVHRQYGGGAGHR